jgi:uncharacterized protein (TIGR00369 family)
MTNNIPEGFVEFNAGDGFLKTTGGLMIKRVDGVALLGLRVSEKHCNPANICHGGMLMTLADMQLAIGSQAAGEELHKFLPTVHMSCDFVAPTPIGSWLEGKTVVTKQTRKLVFANCVLTADGKTVFSASGILKIPSDTGAFSDVMLPTASE